MKAQNTALITIVVTGTISPRAVQHLKLTLKKQSVENAKAKAQKVLRELYVSRCEYLADILAETEYKDHFIISLCPQCLTVSIIDRRTRVYAKGFDACENMLLDLLK